jgi:hypothetical protein
LGLLHKGRRKAAFVILELDCLGGSQRSAVFDRGVRRRSGGVELEKVVSRGDQSPFRLTSGQAASLESSDPAVELRVREHRLDHVLAFGVERFALGGG